MRGGCGIVFEEFFALVKASVKSYWKDYFIGKYWKISYTYQPHLYNVKKLLFHFDDI